MNTWFKKTDVYLNIKMASLNLFTYGISDVNGSDIGAIFSTELQNSSHIIPQPTWSD